MLPREDYLRPEKSFISFGAQVCVFELGSMRNIEICNFSSNYTFIEVFRRSLPHILHNLPLPVTGRRVSVVVHTCI